MKKILALILAALIMIIPAHAFAGDGIAQNLSVDSTTNLAANFYTGGSADNNELEDGDIAFVFASDGTVSIYRYDIDSAETEDGLKYITPDFISAGNAYSGNARWVLCLFKASSLSSIQSATQAGFLTMLELSGNGSNWFKWEGPDAITSNRLWKFINTDPTGTQVMGWTLSGSTITESWISPATIDDTKGNGDTGYAWSADKIFDELALKAPLISPAFTTPNLGTPSAGTLTNCTFPTLNQATTGSAGSLKSTATTGLLDITGPAAGQTRHMTVPDADFTVLYSGGILSPLSSDDPDLSQPGQISHDTDGWLRVYDNSLQKGISLKQEIHITVIKPNDLADAQRDAFLAWSNESGMSFVITGWKGWSDTDDVDLNIETTAADGQTNATVDAVTLATNGTGVFTGADTTITAGTIANGSLLWLDFDDTDAPGYVKVTIYGYYSSDVN